MRNSRELTEEDNEGTSDKCIEKLAGMAGSRVRVRSKIFNMIFLSEL